MGRLAGGLGLLGALLLLAGCGEAGSVGATGGGNDGSGESPLAGRSFQSTGDVGIPGGGPLGFQFTDDGRLLATAGCNSTNGPVQLSDGRLVGTDLAMTEMGCEPEVMASDQWLIDLLAAEPSWELTDDDTLVLTAGDLVVTLVDLDVLEPPVELTGRRWDIDTLVDGDVASSLPAGVEAHLTFDGETVSGHAGCNEFGGTAMISGDTITFGDITATLIGCTPPAASVEQTVLAVLSGGVTFSISGDRLSLANATGQSLQAVAAS